MNLPLKKFSAVVKNKIGSSYFEIPLKYSWIKITFFYAEFCIGW